MKLSYYRWHSINIFPSLAVTSLCDDTEPFDIIGRWYQLTIFGWVVNLTTANDKPIRSKSYGCRGPYYSRKKKSWY